MTDKYCPVRGTVSDLHHCPACDDPHVDTRPGAGFLGHFVCVQCGVVSGNCYGGSFVNGKWSCIDCTWGEPGQFLHRRAREVAKGKIHD